MLWPSAAAQSTPRQSARNAQLRASRCPLTDRYRAVPEPLLAGRPVGELDHDIEVTEVAGVLLE